MQQNLNYSFDPSANDRQNINVQEANFAEEPKNSSQQEDEDQTEFKGTEYKDIFEENKNADIKETTAIEKDKRAKEQESETNNEVNQPSKKGFWSRLFGN